MEDKDIILNLREHSANEIDLTEIELRCLILLSDNDLHPVREIVEFSGSVSIAGVRIVINRIRNKLDGVSITTRRTFGYTLHNKCLIK